MLDQVEPFNLADILKNTAVNESELIELARHNPSLCFEMLDSVLLPWLSSCKQDKHSELTSKALNLLDTQAISELGHLLFCSQRTLERSFRRVTGLSLKQCQSLKKLEAMLEYLFQRDLDDLDWVAVAYQFGFSDQPHLIRTIKMKMGGGT